MENKNIKEVIYNIFEEHSINLNNVNENDSLIEKGIVDSMLFVNILLAIEDTLNIEIDFENIDIQSIVTLKSLCDNISKLSNL